MKLLLKDISIWLCKMNKVVPSPTSMSITQHAKGQDSKGRRKVSNHFPCIGLSIFYYWTLEPLVLVHSNFLSLIPALGSYALGHNISLLAFLVLRFRIIELLYQFSRFSDFRQCIIRLSTSIIVWSDSHNKALALCIFIYTIGFISLENNDKCTYFNVT